MSDFASVLTKILVIGNGMTMLTFGFAFLFIKDKKPVHYWGSCFFLDTAASFIIATAESLGFHRYFPHVLLTEFVFMSLIGPLLFGYFRRLADPEGLPWKGERWLFSFPALYVLLMMPFFILPGQEKLSIYEKICAGDFSGLPYYASLIYAPGPWIIGCCAACVVATVSRARASGRATDRKVRFVVVLTALIACCILAHTIMLIMRASYGILFLLATYTILSAMLVILRYPSLLYHGAFASEPKYRRSKVSGVDVARKRSELLKLMEREKPYLDEELSLSSLSARLGLTSHQLSEILNGEMRTTFKAYINEYRVREARRIILEEPPETILDVAFECGFNSKSNFNKVFKEVTGMTPTEYGESIERE